MRRFRFDKATDLEIEWLVAKLDAVSKVLAEHGRHIRRAMADAADAGYPPTASGADHGGGGGREQTAVEAAVLAPDRVAQSAQADLDMLSRLLLEIVDVERVLGGYVPSPEVRGTTEVCEKCGKPMAGRSRCQERPNGIQCGGIALGSDPSVERSVRMCSECEKRPARQGRRQCETCKARRRRGHHTLADYRNMSGIIEETTA